MGTCLVWGILFLVGSFSGGGTVLWGYLLVESSTMS